MRKIFFLIIGLCTGISMLNAQSVQLSFNPVKGATYTYNYKIEQTIDQKVMGMDVHTLQNISMMYLMTVLQKSKEDVKVAFEYKDIFYEMVNPMMSIRYDSNNPVENRTQIEEMMAKMYDCLIGRKFEAVIALNGTVISLTGMDEVIDDILVSMNLEGAQAAAVEETLRKQMSNEALKANIEQSLQMYPQEQVGISDKWTLDQTIEVANISLNCINHYELTSMDKKEIVLSIESVIDTNEENGLKGTQKGASYLDRKTGMPKQANLSQEMEGVISLQGMTIPIKMLSNVNITIEKK